MAAMSFAPLYYSGLYAVPTVNLQGMMAGIAALGVS